MKLTFKIIRSAKWFSAGYKSLPNCFWVAVGKLQLIVVR